MTTNTNKKLDSAPVSHIPFAIPDIGQEEIDLVVECMKSGWLTSGPKVREFEKNFAEFMGGGVEAISLNSATAGLTLALEAVGVGQGDEVITTPYTFSATGMSAVYLGATPVLVDIDPVTMNIDPAKIEAAITPKTKAIIPVHFAGLSCDMDAIIAIAKKHKLHIIEDAAHALPATYKGKLIGALDTAASVYSFYATKTITTGEGGMVVTRNPDVAARCRTMRLHGISRDVFDRYTSKTANWYYEITAPGFKCNMTDIAAAIGIPQLKKAKKFQQLRESIKQKYYAAFKDLPIILPDEGREGDIHSWHLFVIRLKDDAAISRDEFIKAMAEKYGIGCSVHFIPLNLHPFWQDKLGVNEDSFPLATDAYKRAVSLPIYTKMSDSEVDRVIAATKALLLKC
jgi:dTDP-4-amino-4,6-dideoxygalactose transaminase